MANDMHGPMLLEAMKDAAKALTRTLLFGLLLLLSHLLEIEPSTVDAAGVKFSIRDVIVIQGGLALLFLFNLWSYAFVLVFSECFNPFDPNRLQLRALVRSGRKRYRDEKTKRMTRRTPREVKRRAWWLMLAHNIFFVPVVLIIAGVILLCLLVSIPDVWLFLEYLWSKPWGWAV